MTDQTARPIRTADEIRTCGHTPTQHRTIDGLEADLRTTTREHGEALEQLTQAWAALNQAGYAHPTATVADLIRRCAADRDVARHLVELRTAALSRRTGDLAAAVRVVDAVRTGTLEDIDRAMAAYDAPADLAGPTVARRQTAAERPDSAGEGTEAHRGAQRAHEPNCHADPRAHWTDCECWCHDAIGERDHCENLADLMERAKTVRIDSDDSIWRPVDRGWKTQGYNPLPLDRLEALFGRTRLVLLIDIEQGDEQDETDDAPPPGSGGDHAQGIRPADWEQRAVTAARDALTAAWPALGAGAVAETAVRAIIDAGLAGPGGRCPACGSTYPRTIPAGEDQRCWTCSSEPDPAAVAEHRPAVARVLADVRAGRAATLEQIARDTALLDAALRAGDVDDEMTPAYPATTPTLGEYHWGRAWSPTQDEATCPCPKAPCGYVVRSSEPTGCEYHGPTTTMRGGHTADRCPATTREG